jgi:hypothetical protein
VRIPGEGFGEDFALGIGVDEGLDAGARKAVTVRVASEGDAEASEGAYDGSFGKTGGGEEAAGGGSFEGGVQGGGRFGLVIGFGALGIEIVSRKEVDGDLVQGSLGLDDTQPLERPSRYGKSGHAAGRLVAVGAGFEGGDGVGVKESAKGNVEKHDGEAD